MKKWAKIIVPIIAILLIIPALLPSEFEVTRKIEINQPQESVYSYIVNLEAWPQWSPWMTEDPQASNKFHGIPGVVGSYQEWEGEIVGHGKQTLTQLQEPEYMQTKLEFFSPNRSTATGYMKIEPSGESVTLIWGMRGHLDYPFGRVFGFMIPEMLGKKFDQGLQNLKKRLEATPGNQ